MSFFDLGKDSSIHASSVLLVPNDAIHCNELRILSSTWFGLEVARGRMVIRARYAGETDGLYERVLSHGL